MKWRIGCSGFYYREWKEVFYPKGLAQKDWFKYYCEHFNTIEINSIFYKMPTQKSFDKWYNESPDDFLFTIKAPRLITHYKQLNECEQLINDFYEAIQTGLKEKLGCVLFQFPPKFDYSAERLNLLIENLRPAFNNVVEFRHTSWFDEGVYRKLNKNKITFSGQSYPSALPDNVIQNTATVYYRFHGKPVLYKSEYEINTITDFKNQIKDGVTEVFVYFNNTWGVGALRNAKQLQELVK
ncbi:DUF72 domain-containing protein [Pedobacter alluvionis]|uniref:DUF72 domain-containing protein n=1 Tax=Pedobacter alluvionis TaxID=475253 RepID=A0A497YBZ8_9SPHI|nr:DUF72 domain-containing protein [Pedobacter alluvionis]RLJ80007.1 uncharacterized protein YecE (DUF72 family) [Pedobacter alluvionis]TFB31307.1 DUF72 domain-containing protein [Pedobacter alluvionis]